MPVSWKGVAAIALYIAALWALMGAGILLSDQAPVWAAAAITAAACGLATLGFFRFAATKTDRTHSGEINLVVPPIDLLN